MSLARDCDKLNETKCQHNLRHFSLHVLERHTRLQIRLFTSEISTWNTKVLGDNDTNIVRAEVRVVVFDAVIEHGQPHAAAIVPHRVHRQHIEVEAR